MEAQMVLHTHPANAQREARGLLPVNSLWLSGCGRAQPARHAPVEVDTRLRAPALAEDWPAWSDAWQAIDAGPVAALRDAPHAVLTLAGERGAQRVEARTRPLWQRIAARWRRPEPAALLEGL
jgi:hypothetical protein